MEINEDNFSEDQSVDNFIDYNDNNELLIHLFSKLYQTLNNNKVNIPYNKLIVSKLKKKLFSNIKISSKDEPSIINLLLDKASKLSNFNPDTINHFQNLYHKLIHRRTLTKRWEILYLLNSLSKLPDIYKKLDFPENDLMQKKIWELGNDITGNNLLDTENKFLNCKKLPDNDILNDQLENNNIENIYVTDDKNSNIKLTEKDIITDLLYVLVGIDGKYIKYNIQKDSYNLIDNIKWEENIFEIVNSISEIGWLFYKINKYIFYYKSSKFNSLYIQSFIFAIKNELDEYYKLISFYKKMNNNDLSNDVNHIPSNDNIKEIRKYSKKLNLKNLFMGVIPYKEKLKWILTCCEAILTLKGSAILSQIYSYVVYLGNEKYLNNILLEVTKPFLEFIINWIKFGKIEDPYDEFFVRINNDIKDDDIWKNKYKLIYENIPNFIKRNFVLKIFEIGKCIHFINNFCREKYNLNNLKKVIEYIKNKYFDLESNDKEKKQDINEKEINIKIQEEESFATDDNTIIPEVEENNKFSSQKLISEFDYQINKDKIKHEQSSYESVLNFITFIFSKSESNKTIYISFLDEIIKNIDIIHNLINKDLVRIFIQKFKFKENIEALNKYLLLGQGDMIQNLMESLYTELQKPGNTIYKYVLQSVLESAINSTNARYNDKECLNKLNIKLLKALPGDIGWDVFCLEYNIELPLNNIISSRNLLDYQKMFIFLIKIKRIEYSQNLEWRKIMTYTRDIPSTQYPFFKSKIKKSLQFNQQIMHFIISLHNYLTLEVLETQYKKLIKQIHNVNSIDELISAHNEFVNNIKQKCFLDNKNNNNILIYKKIISIFDIILRFRTAQDVLISTLLQKVNDLDEKEKSLNSQNLDEDESEINYNNRIEESIKQISFLYEEFTNKIIELINNMNNFGLYYLAMKLDFNYYYSNVEKEKDEKEQQILIEKINKEQNRIKIEKQKMKQNLYKDIEYNKNIQNNNNIQNYSIQNNNEINEYNEYISKDNEKNNDINEDDINPNYNININNNMIYNNLTKNLYNKYTNNNYNYNNINNYNDTNENQNIENINKNYPENNNYDYNYKDEEDMGNEGMEEDDQNDDSNIN